jgi:D-glycero-D-manno-heptose 1,7-bisphosphate phosphatase
VVEEVGYLHRPEHVRLAPGASVLISEARQRGYCVGLVTNQAGVGRGYYDWAAFDAVQAELERQLQHGPEPFDFVAACGAHPQAAIDHLRITDHPWRKPSPGMLTKAVAALDIDLGSSIMVGDQITDIQAGASAGVGRLVHVLQGHGCDNRAAVLAFAERLGSSGPTVILADDLSTVPTLLGWA